MNDDTSCSFNTLTYNPHWIWTSRIESRCICFLLFFFPTWILWELVVFSFCFRSFNWIHGLCTLWNGLQYTNMLYFATDALVFRIHLCCGGCKIACTLIYNALIGEENYTKNIKSARAFNCVHIACRSVGHVELCIQYPHTQLLSQRCVVPAIHLHLTRHRGKLVFTF